MLFMNAADSAGRQRRSALVAEAAAAGTARRARRHEGRPASTTSKPRVRWVHRIRPTGVTT